MSRETSATKKYYDIEAANWSDKNTNSFHHEKQFHLLTKFWPEKASIIDIGCANGIHIPLFLGIGRKLKYFGIDISKSFLKISRSRYPQLSFLQVNIEDSESLPKRKFNGFWAAAVLMHVPLEKWDSMFQNIEKLCKPKSYGYISLPTEYPGKEKTDSDIRHFTFLSELEQKIHLKKTGWKIIKSGTMDGAAKVGIWRWYIVQLN